MGSERWYGLFKKEDCPPVSMVRDNVSVKLVIGFGSLLNV